MSDSVLIIAYGDILGSDVLQAIRIPIAASLQPVISELTGQTSHGPRIASIPNRWRTSSVHDDVLASINTCSPESLIDSDCNRSTQGWAPNLCCRGTNILKLIDRAESCASHSPDQRPQVADTDVRDPGKTPTWWQFCFVAHNTTSINDSYFIWHHDEAEVAQTFAASPDTNEQPILTCRGNSSASKMSQLLSNFCQRIDFPTPIPEEVLRASGTFATALFKSHRDDRLDSAGLPFGVRAVKSVNPRNQLNLLRKKTKGGYFPILSYNDELFLHQDEGMLERGLVNYSIIGQYSDGNFAFIVIVDIANEPYASSFDTYPSAGFNIVIVIGCLIYHRALSHVTHPAFQRSTSVLARQIGKHIFDDSTRIVTPPSEVTHLAKEIDMREEVSILVPSMSLSKNKKRSQKRKPKKKQAKQEMVVPTTGNSQSSSENSQASTIVELSTPQEPEVLRHSNTPPPSSRPAAVFSFTSSDRRLICQYGRCMIVANANCPSAVICPRCTAFSFTRYCSLSHLVADIRTHFVSGVCGSTLIPDQVDDDLSSIPLSIIPIRPYIHETRDVSTNAFPKNIVERHRQALWRSMNIDDTVDYWIFDDIDQIRMEHDLLPLTPIEIKKKCLQEVRGTGGVCAVVALSQTDFRKPRLNEVLNGCLRLGFAAGQQRHKECLWLFQVIKGELVREGQWNARMEEMVAVQMGFEFGWKIADAEDLCP